MIYIVQALMSSPNRQTGVRELDDRRIEVNYRFDKETRKKIAAIRSKYKAPIYMHSLRFFSLFICKEEVTGKIKEAIEQADRELKAIDSVLEARVQFIPLDEVEVRKGELYGQIINCIKYQIYKSLFDRIEEILQRERKSTRLNPRTKRSLLRLLDEMRAVNVLEDRDIYNKIDELKRKIEENAVQPLRRELEQEISAITSRWAHLEV